MNTMRSAGFSLIEIIVAVGIFSFLVATFNPNLLATSRIRVTASAQDVLNFTKEARQRSLAVKEFEKIDVTTGQFPNYGVFVDIATPNKIIMYADCAGDDNGDGTLNNSDNFEYPSDNCSLSGGGFDSGLVSELSLAKGTIISDVRVGGVSVAQGYVEFVRPEPTTWVTGPSGGPISQGALEVDVSDTRGRYTKTLSMSVNGLVNVQ